MSSNKFSEPPPPPSSSPSISPESTVGAVAIKGKTKGKKNDVSNEKEKKKTFLSSHNHSKMAEPPTAQMAAPSSPPITANDAAGAIPYIPHHTKSKIRNEMKGKEKEVKSRTEVRTAPFASPAPECVDPDSPDDRPLVEDIVDDNNSKESKTTKGFMMRHSRQRKVRHPSKKVSSSPIKGTPTEDVEVGLVNNAALKVTDDVGARPVSGIGTTDDNEVEERPPRDFDNEDIIVVGENSNEADISDKQVFEAFAVKTPSARMEDARRNQQESDEQLRRRMLNNAILVDVQPEPEDGPDVKSAHSEGLFDKDWFKKYKIRLLILFVLVVIVVVVVASVLAASLSKSSSSTTLDTTIETRIKSVVENVLGSQSANLMDDGNTPQARAFRWVISSSSSFPDDMFTKDEENVDDAFVSSLIEKYALMTLFYSTDGPNWVNDYDFQSTPMSSVCDWNEAKNAGESDSLFNGVYCYDEDGDVVNSVKDIVLVQNGLDGTIPKELRLLSNLQTLMLDKDFVGSGKPSSHDNTLHGSIPTELGNVSTLTNIQLVSNSISGTIPSTFGNHSSLVEINLGSNKNISGTIPSTLGISHNLKGLKLETNALTGTVPTTLGNLLGLTHLWLGRNKLVGTIPSSIDLLENLMSIVFMKNSFNGSIPFQTPYNKPDLERFRVSDNNFVGSIPDSIYTYTNLLDLKLESNQLTGIISTKIGLLRKLTQLTFGDNNFVSNLSNPIIPTEIGLLTDLSVFQIPSAGNGNSRIPREIGNATSLSLVDLSSGGLVGSIPESMGALKNMVKLDLKNNDLTGTLPEGMKDFNKLVEIDISGTSLVGDIDFLCRLSKMSQIRVDCDKHSCATCPNMCQCS